MMPRCRVFQERSGNLIVVHANPRQREADESDDTFYERIFAHAVKGDPTLADLPFADVDSDELPDREQQCECGERHSVRNQWRISGGRVIVKHDAPNPLRDQQHDRALSSAQRAADLETLRTAALTDPVAAAYYRLARER